MKENDDILNLDFRLLLNDFDKFYEFIQKEKNRAPEKNELKGYLVVIVKKTVNDLIKEIDKIYGTETEIIEQELRL